MLRTLEDFKGFLLSAVDGEIGWIQEMYFDDRTWQVRYFVVNTGSWLPQREVLIAPRSIYKIDHETEILHLDLTRDQIRHSPSIDSDMPVSRQFEQAYHDHFGWIPYWLDAGNLPGAAVPEAAAPAESIAELPAIAHCDPHLRSSIEIEEYNIQAQDGAPGHVDDFVIDDQTWRIRYAVVVTRNWFPGKRVLLSPGWIEKISYEKHEVFVSAPSSTIQSAPDFDSVEPITRAMEQELYDHYTHKAYWQALAEATTLH